MNTIRIVGVNIPQNIHISRGLTYIYGIGLTTAKVICTACNIKPDTKIVDLEEKALDSIRAYITQSDIVIGGDLLRQRLSNIKHLIAVKCYRGRRHLSRLPVRGQRTNCNSRTARRING